MAKQSISHVKAGLLKWDWDSLRIDDTETTLVEFLIITLMIK